MNVKIGKSPLNKGQVRIISSKSDGHRSLIAAALAEEESVLFVDGWSDDLEATVRCLEGLGAEIYKEPSGIEVVPIPGNLEKEAVLENIGFVGQHLSLYLSTIGVGSFWKMTKPAEAASGVDSPYPIVITMAFGTPMEPLYREPKEFKRKSLSVISEGDDPRLEAARLAPSAMNEQDWFFSADEGGLHCYRKKHGMLAAAMKNTLNCIDMGIVLCHIAVKSDEFRFEKISDAPVRQGYLYVGTVI